MNSKQAKQLSLPEIMSRLGYEPSRIVRQGREVWYNSPFRKEKDASFHTSYLGNQWIWNDFGDTGGTVVDFVLRHENYQNVKDALAFLDRMFPGHSQSQPAGRGGEESNPQQQFFPTQQSYQFQGAKPSMEALDRQLLFVQASTITNPLIFAYLEGRGIPRELAVQYLMEVRYRNLKNGKEYFAFAMLNESGGYEIRVASDQYAFKSALIARDITLIEGRPNTDSVSVFEGMVDYLSLLVLLGVRKLSGDAIVLHSLSSFQRAAAFIQSKSYATINTFLDNDGAGEGGTARFREIFGERVIVQSKGFAPHHDLNDALKAKFKPVFSAPSPF